MKTALASLVLLVSACRASTPAVQLPQPLYADGASWAFPCQDHGSHIHTISGHAVTVIYTIVSDDGQVFEVPESTLTQAFNTFGINPNEESGQQTSENQVETGPSEGGRCSGPDTGDFSGR